MGLPSIENFDISFIERTAENLKTPQIPYKFTMLLNSLLGLLVVPNEKSDERKFTFNFLEAKITDFPQLAKVFEGQSILLRSGTEEIEQRKFRWLSKSGNDRVLKDISVRELLRRMRNGIAHFGIVPVATPENKKEWCGVIIRNYRDDVIDNGMKIETLNFETCLMETELAELAEFVSQKYLQTVKL